MKPPTQAQIKKEIANSVKSAEKLNTVGMAVTVTDDFGKKHPSKLLHLPWALGHGAMIAHCEGFRSYDCNRIQPG